MKRILISFVCAILGLYTSMACTNFIVGKSASVDGSVICSYNADSYGMYIGLCHYPAAKHAKGEMRKIVDWDTHKYLGEIPEAAETYNVIGNINEFQVTIGETTYGGRHEMVDTTGIIDYGSLIYIGLQRSKTAREAIKVMTSLVEKYGYYSEGETFTICDPNEAWILEMQGCGGDKHNKVVWCAVRIPDNAICAHANQSRIGVFSAYKTEVLHSKNVVSFARNKGWYVGKDKDFSWKNTYAFPDFEGRRFCDARAWSFFNHFHDMSRWLPWALGKDANAEDMPLWILPNRKLSVQDVEMCMRDHYEGTPLSVADGEDIGGGLWEMPYRPSPLTFEVDGKQYFNERPISTQQTGFTFVSQMRNWLPRQIGGVLWFGNDDANMIAYTPIYCGNTIQPECYNTPGADDVTFSDKNAFWVCNWVSNMVYPRYSMLFPTLKQVRDSLENSYFKDQKQVEANALQLYKKSSEEAVKYLNSYSNDKAQSMLSDWKKMAYYMIVKYNDMVVKPEENGAFKMTKEGIAAPTIRPGFSKSYFREVIKQTGDKFAVPEVKK
ncbi:MULTISPECIES: dipeptidase [Segatella]|jgi:dipeptidase|uniref:Dipeptidase n=1 Tax=Segatella bryantii TaxID=77095 RepID=A0ABX4EHF9_SEGBR|nr:MULTISPECIES: C69 family dipeptidase [Segatella]MEE3415253.1 C69 family dipeptidase [Prevotella sp.]OYP53481.1 peptidase C69 [Segatella bryantii]UKK73751.1 C69 family dipeptidase [Segatella bryantii]UKK76890.1 C69 family dipeptidase [Segatella bryantii]UKK81525.1 C69 family dipeptidase [Segatella bryantii]